MMVGIGVEEEYKEISLHLKMSMVEGEKYIRVNSCFLGSLILIPYKSICWIPRETKKVIQPLLTIRRRTRHFLLLCWWRMEFSFISQGHLEHFIYTKTVSIYCLCVFLDYVSASEILLRNTIMATRICTLMVLTDLKARHQVWSLVTVPFLQYFKTW